MENLPGRENLTADELLAYVKETKEFHFFLPPIEALQAAAEQKAEQKQQAEGSRPKKIVLTLTDGDVLEFNYEPCHEPNLEEAMAAVKSPGLNFDFVVPRSPKRTARTDRQEEPKGPGM